LPVSAAALREVDLVGVWRYVNCYPAGIALMRQSGVSGAPDLKKLITHRFDGLDKSLEAFATAARSSDDGGNLVVKVVVENKE
jgi:L-iditol 2-dehydrogenase